jgi:DNA-binding NtrC family response regulator
LQAVHSFEQAANQNPAVGADSLAGWTFGQMVGRSPIMQRVISQMRHTARHLRVAAIEGEAGTGKMLAARTLHNFGSDSAAPFVPCSATQFFSDPALASPRSTANPEFSTLPALKRSRGGTLVLTRVDELTSANQATLIELLQWIDNQHLLGALDSIPRQILCLSGRPMRRLASIGAFRSELANRLTAIRFWMPPLRERREDIPLLAESFVRQFSATHGKPVRGLGPQTLPRLVQHSWPGNVRELESVISSAALNCEGQWIRPIDLPALNALADPAPVSPPIPNLGDDDPNLDRAILRHIQNVLALAQGNKLRAAKMLGISRSTLYRLLDPGSTHPVQ